MHRFIPGQSTSETILSMLRPNREFTPEEARMLDIMMSLHAEHGGGNNSTFTCRVLPTGEIMEIGRAVSKTSSGYSLLHLMIGSEGTLGVITELTLKLIPVPKEDISFIRHALWRGQYAVLHCGNCWGCNLRS